MKNIEQSINKHKGSGLKPIQSDLLDPLESDEEESTDNDDDGDDYILPFIDWNDKRQLTKNIQTNFKKRMDSNWVHNKDQVRMTLIKFYISYIP